MNFPSSPTLNDEYTFNGRTWVYNNTGWALKSTTSSHISQATAAHNATAIEFTPAGGIAATNVATALTELGAQTGDGAASIGFRNRIINGDMRIDQRNAGGSVTTDSSFPVDRWLLFKSGTGTMTVQRSTSTPPAGHSHFVRVTATVADTSAAGEFYGIRQNIEGVNVYDFGFGASGAQRVTISFWVRSSLTGTFSGSLMNSAVNRAYPFTYTITAANTWEQKTITVAGDTSGTWLTDTGVGLRLSFDLGSGSTYLTTANSWAAGNYSGATGQTALMATSSATFDITGVQLEVGAVATPFERRPYGVELALCQRYYETDSYFIHGVGNLTSGQILYSWISYKVPKRVAATTLTKYTESNSGYPNTSTLGATNTVYGFRVDSTANATQSTGYVNFAAGWSADAEL